MMLNYELKKLFAKRSSVFCLVLILAAGAGFNLFAAKSTPVFESDGTRNESLTAVRLLTEEKNKWQGPLTQSVLAKVAAENQKLRQRYGDQIPDDAYVKVIQPASDILEMLGYIAAENQDAASLATISPKQAADFYKLRREKLSEATREYGKTPAQQAFLKEQYARTATPFYYEGADSWEIRTRYAEFYGMVIALLIGLLAAGIFSDEFRLQADPVFFSSRYGRTKAARTKLWAGVIMAAALYWGAMLFYSIIGFVLMGTSGSSVPIQMKWSESVYAITYGQEYVLTLLCGFTASLLSAALTMLISAARHASGIAVCVPFFLFCVSPFLARAIGAELFESLIPQRLFFVDNIIRRPVLFQAGEAVLRQIPALLILYLAISLICLPLIYRVYHRYVMK